MHPFLWLLVLWSALASGLACHAKRDQQPFQIEQNLLKLQCEIMFCTRQRSSSGASTGAGSTTHTCDFNYCHHKLAAHTRPGECPGLLSNVRPTTTPDRDCTADRDCPVAHKCCHSPQQRHRCTAATHLERVPASLLPALPTILAVVQLAQQRRSADLSYEMPSAAEQRADHRPIDMRLMLEARMQLARAGEEAEAAALGGKWGRWHGVEYRYTMWAEQRDSIVYTVTVLGLRPGRRYEFRAAMVGAEGTRGYSAVSEAFQLREKQPQKLLAPRNFSVAGTPRVHRTNGTVYARVIWRPPPPPPQRVNVAIERYRVAWSQVDGNVSAAPAAKSQQQYAWVYEPRHHFEFFDLCANAVYAVHVQAFGGRKRWKSPVETLMLSTSGAGRVAERLLEQQQQVSDRSASVAGSPGKIHIRYYHAKRRSANHTNPAPAPLIARVQWPPEWRAARIELRHFGTGADATRFDRSVHNNDEDNDNNDETNDANESSRIESLAVPPEQHSHEFAALRWHQLYAVRVLNADNGQRWERKDFRTPECSVYRMRHPRVKC